MKEELLKIAQESLSDDEVSKIVKDKFKKAFADAVDSAFSWGAVKDTIKSKITEVMVPYIEKRDFSEFLPKLDTVLTELVNSDACIGNKQILENFKDLMTEPDVKEIKLTDLFSAWIKFCEKEIDTDNLEICYDDGVSYCPVECTMQYEEEDKPSWSSQQRAVITFENEHDEKLNVEIPISKWVWDSGKEEPYTLTSFSDIAISSLKNLDEFQLLLLRLARAGTAIVIDKDYESGDIYPEKEPEASFS